MDIVFVEWHQLTTQPLAWLIPIYNINSTLNKAGSIWCVMECILHYCNHAEWVVFAVTSLEKQDIISRLHLHNPDIDWSIGEVKISQCLCHYSTCAKEVRVEAYKQASIRACQWSCLPYPNLDLLDPLLLVFSCK